MHLPVWVLSAACLVACGFTPPPGQVSGDGGVTLPTVGFLAEGSLQDEESGAVMVPLALGATSAERVTVEYEIVDGSAERGRDFEGASGSITIEAGQTQGAVPVTILDDEVDEQNETFEIRLRAATGAVIGALDRHEITISANVLPRASITLAASTNEEDVRPRVMVLLSPAAPMPVTIEMTVSGTVGQGDYGAFGTAFEIPANTSNHEIELPIIDDAIDEDPEDFILTLTGSPHVIITNARTRTHTITDNDAPPRIEFATANAETSESGTVDLDVQLSTESGKTIDFTVSSTVGTQASVTKDYSYEATTYTIPPGATTARVRVQIVADALDEIDEALVTKIDSATNATVTGRISTNLSILDDDPTPTVSFLDCNDGTTPEPTVGSTNVPRTITLSAPSGRQVEVTLTPDNGNNNADAGDDYDIPATVTIPAEQMTATFNIRINADTAVQEGSEEIIFSMTAATAAMIGMPATCLHNIN